MELSCPYCHEWIVYEDRERHNCIQKQAAEKKALAAIKEAFKHPRYLTPAETVEFISRPVYIGAPEPVPRRERVQSPHGEVIEVSPELAAALCPPGKRLGKVRGPKTKRTQYDDAYERRRGLYQRLVRLPAESKKGTEKRHAVSARTRTIIEPIARELRKNKTPQAHLVREIARVLRNRRSPQFHPTTIRRALKGK